MTARIVLCNGHIAEEHLVQSGKRLDLLQNGIFVDMHLTQQCAK
jgi:hypothetical protein